MPVHSGGRGSVSSDHFAPLYVVGNVPAGDPAAAQLGAFRYIPDPGDGTGIALALDEATNVRRGDVYIRSGQYTYAGPRMIIPSYCQVFGDGSGGGGVTTTVTGGTADNCIFSMSVGARLANIALEHDGSVVGVGSALVQSLGPGISLDNIYFHLGAAPAGGALTAAVFLTGNGVNRIATMLDDLKILMPDGVGGSNTALWMAGIRGDAVVSNSHIAILSDIWTDRGDVGVMTLGVEMVLEACEHQRLRRMAWYASSGRLSVQGRRSVVTLNRAGGGELAGCQLIGSTFKVSSAQFTIATPSAIPAIYISGGAGIAVPYVDGCDIGTGFSPSAIVIGNAAETVRDARIVNNVITLANGIVPVAIGAGADNTQVQGNVSRGSGATLPTNLGTGSNIANNIWGA